MPIAQLKEPSIIIWPGFILFKNSLIILTSFIRILFLMAYESLSFSTILEYSRINGIVVTGETRGLKDSTLLNIFLTKDTPMF